MELDVREDTVFSSSQEHLNQPLHIMYLPVLTVGANGAEMKYRNNGVGECLLLA